VNSKGSRRRARATAIAVVALALFGLAASAAAREGLLDPSFGHNGTVLTGIGVHPAGHSQQIVGLAVGADASTVIGARDPRGGFTIERLLADGSLDPGFGSDGQVATSIRTDALALAPDGSVVVVGSVGGGEPGQDLGILRYRPDGSIDRGFGRKGLVRLDRGLREEGEAVAVEPDGTIVVGVASFCEEGDHDCRWEGHSRVLLVRLRADGKVLGTSVYPRARLANAVAAGANGQLALAVEYYYRADQQIVRFGANGARLTSFGKDGAVSTGSRSESGAVDLLENGKVVLAGFGLGGGGLRQLTANGDADTGFGNGGTATCAPAEASYEHGVASVAAMPDGRLLAAGGAKECGLVRYLPQGTPDPGFGSGGRVDSSVAIGGPAQALASGPGETAVVARWQDGVGIRLARYRADGSLDPGFGDGGAATVPSSTPTYDSASALLALPQGKLLAVGTAACADGSCGDFALARYRRDGRLDRGFGQGGVVTTDPEGVGFATAAAIQPNRRIVVVGGSAERVAGELVKGRLALARYLPDGGLDPSFAGDGVLTVASPVGDEIAANAVAIARNGDIVVAGRSSCDHSDQCGKRYCSECGKFLVARFHPDGAPVAGFGRDGIVTVDVGHSDENHDTARAVAIQPDGKIVAAGESYLGGFGLLRLFPNGKLDRSFGRRGAVSTSFSVRLRDDGGKSFLVEVDRPGRAMTLTPNGEILVAGGRDAGGRGKAVNHGVIVRYRSNGEIDRRFGHKGDLDLPFGIGDVALDRCGRIVAAGGYTPKRGVDRFGVTRRLPSGALDRSFSRGGIEVGVGVGEDSHANALALGHGDVVLAGVAETESQGDDFALVAVRDAGACRR
jgi:uncharacterized delta-60 repeat protein